MSAIAAGSVKTTWKYGTGSSSACRCLHPLARRRALALRAMPVAAGVVGDGGVAAGAVLAARDVAAERRRAAALDRRHHLQLAKAQVATVGGTPSAAMVAEDIRDLQGRAGHGAGAMPAGPSGRAFAASAGRAGSSTVRNRLVATCV